MESKPKISILGKPLREIFLEIIIVVLGILIAFFLDNWWSGVQIQDERNHLLQSLEEEFESNARFVDRKLEEIDRARSCAIDILYSSEERLQVLPPRKLDSLLYFTLTLPEFEPGNTTVEDMVHSGKTELLQNRALETFITRWNAGLEEKEMMEGEAAERIERFILEYLYDHLSFPRLDKQFSHLKSYPGTLENDDHNTDIFKDRKFINFVDDQVYHYHKYEEKLMDLQEVIESVLMELNEIGK